MPPLSTHLHFATLLMNPQGIASQAGLFLLGPIAPDAFERDSEESFTQHHFIGQDGKISLTAFAQATGFSVPPSDQPEWSLGRGYYAHLWLDVYDQTRRGDLPAKRPNDLSDDNSRLGLRKETEYLNAPDVLEWVSKQFPWPDSVLTSPALGFIDVQRCRRLFQDVLAQTRESMKLPVQLVLIDPSEYGLFLRGAADKLLDESKDAA
jgi:hypothetical protein